jgi:Xaa-Pro aminopeptidase
LLDAQRTPAAVQDRLSAVGAVTRTIAEPVIAAKARKNEAELEGMRRGHLRDGAAVSAFLAWLEGSAPAGRLYESEVAAELDRRRARLEGFRDTSFGTISAAGAHAALPHYRVTGDSDAPLRPGSVYLVDSGGQYSDATTDITRTIAIGRVEDAAIRTAFTRVLQGLIAASTALFPVGTPGSQIDAFARRPLWAAGLDYGHGTGHGVGSFLGVHEGPARLAKSAQVALEPGMVLSIEPGYYRPGAFGIRTENLVIVREMAARDDAGRAMLGFETLTLAPIDKRLIESSALTAAEIQWLDAYHARVRASLEPLVDAETAGWLSRACAPIAR